MNNEFVPGLYLVKSYGQYGQIEKKFYENEKAFLKFHKLMLNDKRCLYIDIYRFNMLGSVRIDAIYKN